MSYNKRYINVGLKGIAMSSVLVGSLLQLGVGEASATIPTNADLQKDFDPGRNIKTAQVKVIENAYKDQVISMKVSAIKALENVKSFVGTIKSEAEALEIELTQTSDTVARVGSLRGTSPTNEGEMIGLLTPEETLAKGYEVFSSDEWSTGDYSPRNYSDPNLEALGDNSQVVQSLSVQTAQTKAVQKLAITQYKDYDSSAYWAKDMKWAVEQGLISGYQNQKHPTQPAKGVGNWLNPYGNLSEYQMLNVILRYKDGANYEAAKTTMQDKVKNNFAYVEYYFAQKHGIVTKGSINTSTYAKQTVTRGQLAQALVSMHYGKSVTVQQAVTFLYENNLSTGINPSLGKTYANFGVNNTLARAQIVAFMGRYNDAKVAGTLKDTLNSGSGTVQTPKPPVVNSGSSENPAPPSFSYTKYDYSNLHGSFSTSKGFTKDGIKVSYKNHTYNVKSQAEYDQVMNHVIKILKGKTYSDTKLPNENTESDLKILEGLMNGSIKPITDRTDPNYRTSANSKALGLLDTYGDVINNNVTFETLAKFKVATAHTSYFVGSTTSTWGPPESAYDFFIKDYIDCTSYAYAKQAIYDSLGYNTAVIHSPKANHDYVIVELDGKWYKDDSILTHVTKETIKTGDYIKYAPAKHADKLSFVTIH